MKKQDLKSKSHTELHTLKQEAGESMKKFQSAIASGKTKNVREGRLHRRQIARINTHISHHKNTQTHA